MSRRQEAGDWRLEIGGIHLAVQEAKSRVREYFHRLLNEKDLSVCDELLAPDYIDHDAGPDSPPGPKATREWVADFLDDYPDMRIRIEDLFAEDNKVALRLVWEGTHRQTGERYQRMGIVILRMDEAGRIAERWSASA